MDRYGVGLLKIILFLVLISGGRSEIPGTGVEASAESNAMLG